MGHLPLQPLPISEIAPAHDRGRLVGLYQFNIVFGILIAFLSNYLLSDLGENAWRYMMGVEALPALLYTFMVYFIPKSPRWLFLQQQEEEAKAIIKAAYNEDDATALIKDISTEQENIPINESIFDRKYRFILSLAFLIAFFNQFSGINAFLYYAPRIFEEGGLGESTALLSSVGIGLVNLIFTLLGINLIDKLGRKILMYIGSIGYIISLSLIAASFLLQWEGLALPLFLFFYCFACHWPGRHYLGFHF